MVVATPVAGSDQTSVTEEKLKQDRRVALQKADDYGRFAEQARRENRQLAERESTWKKRHSELELGLAEERRQVGVHKELHREAEARMENVIRENQTLQIRVAEESARAMANERRSEESDQSHLHALSAARSDCEGLKVLHRDLRLQLQQADITQSAMEQTRNLDLTTQVTTKENLLQTTSTLSKVEDERAKVVHNLAVLQGELNVVYRDRDALRIQVDSSNHKLVFTTDQTVTLQKSLDIARQAEVKSLERIDSMAKQLEQAKQAIQGQSEAFALLQADKMNLLVQIQSMTDKDGMKHVQVQNLESALTTHKEHIQTSAKNSLCYVTELGQLLARTEAELTDEKTRRAALERRLNTLDPTLSLDGTDLAAELQACRLALEDEINQRRLMDREKQRLLCQIEELSAAPGGMANAQTIAREGHSNLGSVDLLDAEDQHILEALHKCEEDRHMLQQEINSLNQELSQARQETARRSIEADEHSRCLKAAREQSDRWQGEYRKLQTELAEYETKLGKQEAALTEKTGQTESFRQFSGQLQSQLTLSKSSAVETEEKLSRQLADEHVRSGDLGSRLQMVEGILDTKQRSLLVNEKGRAEEQARLKITEGVVFGLQRELSEMACKEEGARRSALEEEARWRQRALAAEAEIDVLKSQITVTHQDKLRIQMQLSQIRHVHADAS